MSLGMVWLVSWQWLALVGAGWLCLGAGLNSKRLVYASLLAVEVQWEMPTSSLPSAVTIGVFDGVHLGHQELLANVVKRAQQDNLLATVLTFEPHPAFLLRPNNAPQLLTDLNHKLSLFEKFGMHRTVVLKFNQAVAEIAPERFVKDFLVDSLNVQSVVVGDDFHFGNSRTGSVETLKQQSQQYDFEVEAVSLYSLSSEPEPISSTAIRRALAGGRVKEVTRMLGRPYSIEGEVIEGDRRGHTIGFPTANLPVSQLRAWPTDGVYAGWFTDSAGVKRPCAINIGRRPTFYHHAEHSILEAHLLDFDGDLYGQFVEVEFAEFLRSEKRFGSIDELKQQLHKDIEKCREILQTT